MCSAVTGVGCIVQGVLRPEIGPEITQGVLHTEIAQEYSGRLGGT